MKLFFFDAKIIFNNVPLHIIREFYWNCQSIIQFITFKMIDINKLLIDNANKNLIFKLSLQIIFKEYNIYIYLFNQ